MSGRGIGRSGTLAWLRQWGVSVASLLSGLLTLFVFRRGLPHLRWIVGYLLLLWLLFALLTQLRQALESRGHRFVVSAADYTIQTLYHGLLLFVLPAYWASTTLASPNVAFFALLVGMALVATFDPCYRAVVHPRPWLGVVFFLVSIFAALAVALPLVGVPPYPALLASAFLSVVALTPAVRRALGWPWGDAVKFTVLVAIGVAWLAGVERAWIPPAPLALAHATLARAVANGEPVHPLEGPATLGELASDGLVAYTAVYAPAGLRQPIVHVWRHGDRIVNVVALTPVRGGRRDGFRTYSHKASFPADAVGDWTVDVMTNWGQLIGRLRFRVVP